MRAPRFIAHPGALCNHPRQLQHVVQLPRKYDGCVRPVRAIAQVNLAKALQHLDQLGIGLLQILVVADDGAVLGHQLTQFAPQLERILRAVSLHQRGVDVLLTFLFGRKASIAVGCGL